MSIRYSMAALVLIGCAGCSLFGSRHGQEGVTTGTYSWGFEDNTFTPCNRGEAWWVVVDEDHASAFDSLQAQYGRTAENPYEQVYVRLRGYAGPEGSYGHLGSYAREFYLEEVVELRKAGLGDCYLPD